MGHSAGVVNWLVRERGGGLKVKSVLPCIYIHTLYGIMVEFNLMDF